MGGFISGNGPVLLESRIFMQWLLKRILGTKNERDLKKLRPLVGRINEQEQRLQSLSDEALRAKTEEFRGRLAAGAALLLSSAKAALAKAVAIASTAAVENAVRLFIRVASR